MAQAYTFTAVGIPGAYGPILTCRALNTLDYTVVGTIDANCHIILQRSTDGLTWETAISYAPGVQNVAASIVPEVDTVYRFHAEVASGTMTSMAVSLAEIVLEGEVDADLIKGIPVDPTAPTDGQVLAFNETSGKYEPADQSGGGGSTAAADISIEDTQDYFPGLDNVEDALASLGADRESQAADVAQALSVSDAAATDAATAVGLASTAQIAADAAQASADALNTPIGLLQTDVATAQSTADGANSAAGIAISDAAAALDIAQNIPINVEAFFLLPAPGDVWRIPVASECNFTSWQVTGDGAGSIAFTVSKSSGGDMIGSGNAPALSSASEDTQGLSGWSLTDASAGQIITFTIASVSGLTKAHVRLVGRYGL